MKHIRATPSMIPIISNVLHKNCCIRRHALSVYQQNVNVEFKLDKLTKSLVITFQLIIEIPGEEGVSISIHLDFDVEMEWNQKMLLFQKIRDAIHGSISSSYNHAVTNGIKIYMNNFFADSSINDQDLIKIVPDLVEYTLAGLLSISQLKSV